MWLCGKQMWSRGHVQAAFLLPAGVWDWNHSLGRELEQKAWVMCKNWSKERCRLDWWWRWRKGWDMDAFIWASWSRSKGSGRCLTSANDPCALVKNPQRWIELFSLNRTLYACTDTSALYVAAVGEETPLLRDGWSPVTSTHHGYNLYGSRSGP